jgi:hypothetical protein
MLEHRRRAEFISPIPKAKKKKKKAQQGELDIAGEDGVVLQTPRYRLARSFIRVQS